MELHGRALGQIFLPQLQTVDDCARPGFAVVGLIADDEMDRIAGLAVVKVGCVHVIGGGQAEAGQSPNRGALNELAHNSLLW